jgi:hypothetical protein
MWLVSRYGNSDDIFRTFRSATYPFYSFLTSCFMRHQLIVSWLILGHPLDDEERRRGTDATMTNNRHSVLSLILLDPHQYCCRVSGIVQRSLRDILTSIHTYMDKERGFLPP